ncbi:MAG TPA: Zn-ribbon domain-containing OB-fold protein [Kineobactrum sp.]
MKRIQPLPGPLSDEYFAGCNRGELLLQACAGCGALQFYPRSICTSCNSSELQWVPASGRGHVASFTVVRRAISAAYEAPYVVALIRLEEGPQLMSHIVECAPERIGVGAAVTVAFQAWSETQSMPVFTLDEH